MQSDNIKKIKLLSSAYDTYHQPGMATKWLIPADLTPVIDQIGENSAFELQKLGESVQERDIRQVTWGNGDIKVAMWSQIHGNESTATRSLCDLMNFLGGKDEFEEMRRWLKDSLTLYIVPMLNPDGAEEYTRRNALGIDLNRDALALQCPESRILQGLIHREKPAFGFNLHDQSRYYRVGDTNRPSTVSFLAPAYDPENSIDTGRRQVMNMISALSAILQEYIPGHVARYDDAFNERAFGDNIKRWGTSTVLFEAGEYPGDPQREFVRKLTFLSMVSALAMIAEGLPDHSPEAYFDIPLNNENMADLLLKNVSIRSSEKEYEVDIAINKPDEGKGGEQKPAPGIVDIGDLRNYAAYHEKDLAGYRLVDMDGRLHPGEEISFLFEDQKGSTIKVIDAEIRANVR